MTNKLLFVVTEDWYFCSHRFELALAAKAAGFDVIVATRMGEYKDRIEAVGFRFYEVPFSRSLRHPWRDVVSFLALLKIYRRERPGIIHHVSLKPVLLGSLAARLCRTRHIVNALTGLGYLFTDTASGRAPFLRRLIHIVLRWLLCGNRVWTIMQNADDAGLLVNMKILNPGHTVVIRGSGVDIQRFRPSSEPATMPKVLLASRMLRDKGVIEFVDAARILLQEKLEAEFILAGSIDKENPSAIEEAEIRQWEKEGLVKWIGHQKEMVPVLVDSHIVCLPSYREGLPRVLLEAAATGRPIVATDVPGCREIVHQGENGFLVPVKDPVALADAIKRLVTDPVLRRRMGEKGRKIVESDFANGIVHEQTLALYERLLRTA